MENHLVSRDYLISTPENLRPHVVILGAGASLAAFPNGDAKGKPLPLMDNLIEVVGLGKLLEDNKIEYKDRNFEVVYSELFENNPNSSVLKKLEEAIYNYFESLSLPSEPSLYDHLLLSLKPKDVVATFNWDPFLYDAWERITDQSHQIKNVLFLHGNVRIGVCEEDGFAFRNGCQCETCDKILTPTKILYPVSQKNYSNDLFIKSQWDELRYHLRNAFTLTIFGYSAPKTDKDAVDLMLGSWKEEINREIATVHFIDIIDEQTLAEQWRQFNISCHYQCSANFYQSYIAQFPRRSCEALKFQTIDGKFAEQFPYNRDMSFDELHRWFDPLWKAEET